MDLTSKHRPRRGVRACAVTLAVMAYGASMPMLVRAEAAVAPPCNAELPQPPYAAVGATPNVLVWNQGSLPEFSNRAACVGWPAPNFELLGAMIYYIDAFPERFHHPKEDEYLFRLLRVRHPDAAPLLDRLNIEHRAPFGF